MPLDTTTRAKPAIGERQVRDAIITKATGDDAAARRVTFIASDESVDRYGDIIRASGWQLTNFIRNPVLLFGHQSSQLPIGRVPDVRVEGTRLLATADFRPEGDNAFADDIWLALQGGFLNAVSVGFLPTVEPKIMRDEEDRFSGFEFVGQELLELSVVPVPANPAALALARDLGISAEAQRRLMVRDDERAAARIAAEQRRRSITLARLRPGHFGG
jgi:HK97 family phage prohead protease